MKKARVILSAALAGAFVFSGATAANAASSHQLPGTKPLALHCTDQTTYEDENDTYAFTKASGSLSEVVGGPGVTLTISRTTTFTISGSVETTGGFSASIDVATVSAAVGQTVGVSLSGEATSSGAWTVPSTYKQGALEIGALVHSGDVARYLTNTACVVTKEATSKYKLPVQALAFEHFKLS